MHNSNIETNYYLESSGYNAEQQSDEEEKNEGDGCAPHVILFLIFFCLNANLPSIVSLNVHINIEIWMHSNMSVNARDNPRPAFSNSSRDNDHLIPSYFF